jgi:hypothetical protein
MPKRGPPEKQIVRSFINDGIYDCQGNNEPARIGWPPRQADHVIFPCTCTNKLPLYFETCRSTSGTPIIG